ncbi:MAG: hypothetical protein ACMXX7_01960 [Candidatus Woesearchaeota archaeon]
MEDEIKLGLDITLKGFKDANPGEITIIKKMIGNAVREKQIKTLYVEKIADSITINTENKETKANHKNIFFALGNALKKI